MTGGDAGLDPFETLGVTRLATDDDIRLAYRHLVKRYHPDLHPGDATLEDRIREINEAYAILSDPARKAALDQEPEFDEVPQPKARPQPASRRAQPAPAAAARAEDKRTSHTDQDAAWETIAGFFFYAALALTVGMLLARLGILVSSQWSSHISPATVLHLAEGFLLGFLVSLKLPLLVGSWFLRDRARERWSVAFSVAVLFFLLMPLHISLYATLHGHFGTSEQASAEPPVADDDLPDVPRSLRQSTPAPGLSVPEQRYLHDGFALADEEHVYTTSVYKTVYTLDSSTPEKRLAFEESLEVPYAPAPDTTPDIRYFTALGYPGYATYHLRQDGTVDGYVHWSDHGHDLVIHVSGVLAQDFPEQNLTAMLGAVRRVPPLEPAAATLVSRAAPAAPVAPPPPVRAASDPCGPGTVCYDRKMYGHNGWYLQRGHGNAHPT